MSLYCLDSTENTKYLETIPAGSTRVRLLIIPRQADATFHIYFEIHMYPLRHFAFQQKMQRAHRVTNSHVSCTFTYVRIIVPALRLVIIFRTADGFGQTLVRGNFQRARI
jgi:hypothetical protein